LRREAATLAGLRAEEARLKEAMERTNAARVAAAVKSSLTADGQPILSVKELDVQPKPILRVRPKYPADLKVLGMEGEALVTFVVGADGHVREVEVDRATNDAFGEAATKALEQWKFKPAQKGGFAVNCRVSIPLVFSIDKKGSVDWF